jgi:hypothetical protein
MVLSGYVSNSQTGYRIEVTGTKEEKMMGSCNTLLNDYFTWANQQDLKNGKALVGCTVVSNQNDGTVSFATGDLEFRPAQALGDGVTQPAQFSGELVRFFVMLGPVNDASPAGGIRVTISLEREQAVSITLSGWQETTFSFEPQCLAGVMYGVGPADAPSRRVLLASEALYVVSLDGRSYEANA